MVAKDYIKQEYCNALLNLSKTKKLGKITVSDVVKETGTSRQTFYSRFRDINDLIFYVPISFIEECRTGRMYTIEMAEVTFRNALKYKDFYCQLPYHTGQNNFRESFVAWQKDHHYKSLSADVCKRSDFLERKLRVDLFIHGAAGLFFEWCEGQMKTPVEPIVKAIYESAPSFLRGYLDGTEEAKEESLQY